MVKYILAFFLLFTVTILFSQGAGIRYTDSIPSDTPNIALRNSVMVFNNQDSTFYLWESGKWRLLPKPDSIIYKNDNGEVIIGATDNGSYKFQVNGMSNFTDDIDVIAPINSNLGFIIDNESATSNASATIDVITSSNDLTIAAYPAEALGTILGIGRSDLNAIYSTSADTLAIGTAGAFPMVLATNDTLRLTISSTGIINVNLPTYADDTAAGVGGLVTGDIYQTGTGELRIKL